MICQTEKKEEMSGHFEMIETEVEKSWFSVPAECALPAW